jgi:DNA-binding NtrC family response regulator
MTGERAQRPAKPGAPPGAKILAISYDKALLDTRRMILELHGYEVTTALGWSEALHMCGRAREFDLVMIGSSIPRSDKEKLLNEAKSNGAAKVLSIRRPGDPPLPRAEYSIESLYDPQALVDVVREATAK